MAVNKVVYNGTTLIDLTNDSVTASKLASGYTAHTKSGSRVTGTMASGIPNNFSTSETTIGTWVDGKKVHRKCYYMSSLTLTGDYDNFWTWVPFADIDTNARIINSYGSYYIDNNCGWKYYTQGPACFSMNANVGGEPYLISTVNYGPSSVVTVRNAQVGMYFAFEYHGRDGGKLKNVCLIVEYIIV